jgi:tetratricopeptide (TPR) repeat protein
MSKIGMLSAAAIVGLMAGSAALAQESVTVLGPTLFEECGNAAAAAQRTSHVGVTAIDTCSQAIARSWSTVGETANAFVNRGTLYLIQGQNDKAINDFTQAIKADPSQAAAYNDRGVALSATHHQADAIKDFSQALALKAGNADHVLFNRAMAYEDSGDLKRAYLDYRKAAELNPGWSEPARQLARFNVKTSPAS